MEPQIHIGQPVSWDEYVATLKTKRETVKFCADSGCRVLRHLINIALCHLTHSPIEQFSAITFDLDVFNTRLVNFLTVDLDNNIKFSEAQAAKQTQQNIEALTRLTGQRDQIQASIDQFDADIYKAGRDNPELEPAMQPVCRQMRGQLLLSQRMVEDMISTLQKHMESQPSEQPSDNQEQSGKS